MDISWSIDFALYHCPRIKLFLYIKKWRRREVFVSLWALALVFIVFLNKMRLTCQRCQIYSLVLQAMICKAAMQR